MYGWRYLLWSTVLLSMVSRPAVAGVPVKEPEKEPLHLQEPRSATVPLDMTAYYDQALALREARLQKAVKESRIRQLQLAVELAETEQALRALQQPANQGQVSGHAIALTDIQLRALWHLPHASYARLSYADRMWRVQDGDEVLASIRVRIHADHVVLQREQEQYTLWPG